MKFKKILTSLIFILSLTTLSACSSSDSSSDETFVPGDCGFNIVIADDNTFPEGVVFTLKEYTGYVRDEEVKKWTNEFKDISFVKEDDVYAAVDYGTSDIFVKDEALISGLRDRWYLLESDILSEGIYVYFNTDELSRDVHYITESDFASHLEGKLTEDNTLRLPEDVK